MSTEHEILMHSFNGTDFDDLYPKSKTNLIEDSNGKNLDELLYESESVIMFHKNVQFCEALPIENIFIKFCIMIPLL